MLRICVGRFGCHGDCSPASLSESTGLCFIHDPCVTFGGQNRGGARSDRFCHLDALSFSEFPELLFFPLPFFFLALLQLPLVDQASVGLHVFQACLVVVGVRVGVFVILSDILELLLAESAIKWL